MLAITNSVLEVDRRSGVGIWHKSFFCIDEFPDRNEFTAFQSHHDSTIKRFLALLFFVFDGTLRRCEKM